MSDRWQRVFKWIVWIVIFSLVIWEVYGLARKLNNPEAFIDNEPVTRAEWMIMLADGFGDTSLLTSVADPDGYTTGKYAALTSMQAIGEDRVEKLAKKSDLSDDEKVDLAIEKGVVEKGQIKGKITKGEANQILLNALDLYADPDYYPEFFEADTKEKVIDADKWNVSSFDADSNIMVAKIDGEAPEPGRIIMFTNDE